VETEHKKKKKKTLIVKREDDKNTTDGERKGVKEKGRMQMRRVAHKKVEKR